MKSISAAEERVIYNRRFQGIHFDFRGKSIFTRFDHCEFVKCTLFIDRGTEQLSFTECAFKDCNVDRIEEDEQRGLYVRGNDFHRPIKERWAEFENRLSLALIARKAKAFPCYDVRLNPGQDGFARRPQLGTE
jgi:hypothetical protein